MPPCQWFDAVFESFFTTPRLIFLCAYFQDKTEAEPVRSCAVNVDQKLVLPQQFHFGAWIGAGIKVLFTIRPLLLFSLFLVACARSFFPKIPKKKSSFEINQAAACSHPVTLASACKSHDTTIKNRKAGGNQARERHFQVVAWTTKIVKGSSQSFSGRSIKTEKRCPMAFAICWCVLEFFKPSTFASSLEARQRRGRSTTTVTFRRSLLRQQRRVKVWRWSSTSRSRRPFFSVLMLLPQELCLQNCLSLWGAGEPLSLAKFFFHLAA